MLLQINRMLFSRMIILNYTTAADNDLIQKTNTHETVEEKKTKNSNEPGSARLTTDSPERRIQTRSN